MVDAKHTHIKVSALTDRDAQMAESLSPKWKLTKSAPVSLVDLAGSKLISPYLYQGSDIYTQLSEAPVTMFSATNPEGSQEFIMLGPNITAEQVNALMFFAAPYKGFGFDTRDIINDWTDLYEKSVHAQRKAAHANMPGWSSYENSRERVLGILKRNFKERSFRDQDENDTITPVLRWTETPNGKTQIVLSPMDDELKEAIVKAAPDQIQNTDVLDSGMGIMFLSAYSPSQTKWKDHDGYTEKAGKKQPIGPTQVLAYAFRMLAEQQAGRPIPSDQDIQESPFLKGFTQYIKTGEMPHIEVKEAPVTKEEFASKKLTNNNPLLKPASDSALQYLLDSLPQTQADSVSGILDQLKKQTSAFEIIINKTNKLVEKEPVILFEHQEIGENTSNLEILNLDSKKPIE
ncbi:MAG: hypothetical protein KA035_02575 [Candidatus Levybacteria bacterium]|nr:hypothetical protein [Candidatus Levybacteria bacterium]